MPMGVVSDNEFEKEKKKIQLVESELPISHDSLPSGGPGFAGIQSNQLSELTQAEIVEIKRGRPKGSVEIPNGLRKLIGDTSITEGREASLELANQFGISSSSTSAYHHGATSTASYDNQTNKSVIDDAKLRVSKRARTKLMAALRNITEEKLEVAKPGELAGVASQMSAIIKNMEPESVHKNGNQVNAPTFIFYSPKSKSEEQYDIVRLPE